MSTAKEWLDRCTHSIDDKRLTLSEIKRKNLKLRTTTIEIHWKDNRPVKTLVRIETQEDDQIYESN